jgi:hypothetical protein
MSSDFYSKADGFRNLISDNAQHNLFTQSIMPQQQFEKQGYRYPRQGHDTDISYSVKHRWKMPEKDHHNFNR